MLSLALSHSKNQMAYGHVLVSLLRCPFSKLCGLRRAAASCKLKTMASGQILEETC